MSLAIGPRGSTSVTAVGTAPRSGRATVLFKDPSDNGVVKKVTKGDVIRVELLRGFQPWIVPRGFKTVGYTKEAQIVEMDTAATSTRAGRLKVHFSEAPVFEGFPWRTFNLVADVADAPAASASG